MTLVVRRYRRPIVPVYLKRLLTRTFNARGGYGHIGREVREQSNYWGYGYVLEPSWVYPQTLHPSAWCRYTILVYIATA